MKISTAELKKFKANSFFIKKTGILPILGYIKFNNGSITKTNLHSFAQQKTEFEGNFLVPEMNLFNFLSRTTEAYIDISVKKDECTISDGRQPVVKCSTEDISYFPSTPVPNDDEPAEISNEVLCAINFSSNFVDYMDLPDHRGHVFVGGELVAGMNGWIGFNQKIKGENLPQMVLTKDMAITIGKFHTARFLQNEKHVFFDVDDTRFGFLKPTFPYMDLLRFSVIKDEWNRFDLNKEDLLSFAETCVTQNVEKTLCATINIKNDKLDMSMVEPNYRISVNHSVNIVGNMFEPFNFQPSLISTLLKNIPDSDLSVHQSPTALHITGDSGFIALIQQMIKN